MILHSMQNCSFLNIILHVVRYFKYFSNYRATDQRIRAVNLRVISTKWMSGTSFKNAEGGFNIDMLSVLL